MRRHSEPRRYLQACEIGGSIYGKAPRQEKGDYFVNHSTNGEDLINAYNSLYKKQFEAFDRVFRRK